MRVHFHVENWTKCFFFHSPPSPENITLDIRRENVCVREGEKHLLFSSRVSFLPSSRWYLFFSSSLVNLLRIEIAFSRYRGETHTIQVQTDIRRTDCCFLFPPSRYPSIVSVYKSIWLREKRASKWHTERKPVWKFDSLSHGVSQRLFSLSNVSWRIRLSIQGVSAWIIQKYRVWKDCERFWDDGWSMTFETRWPSFKMNLNDRDHSTPEMDFWQDFYSKSESMELLLSWHSLQYIKGVYFSKP